jgi:LAS superfamily LD-carboxypeptidase LdcB
VRELIEQVQKDQERIDEVNWKAMAGGAAIAATVLAGTPQFAAAKPPITTSLEHTQGLTSVLHSKLEQLKTLANKEGIDFKVITGYRSQQEQEKLYAQGRTTPGRKVTWTRNSKHTQGKAFDIAMLKGGKVTWEPGEYQRLGQLGDWKVRDLGHFEVN